MKTYWHSVCPNANELEIDQIEQTQRGAILLCRACCVVFIIEHRRFSNTAQRRLKEI